MATYKHLMFATDLTEENAHTIPRVKKLAELYGAKLSVVHVVEHLATVAYGYIGSFDIEQQLLEEAKNEMKKVGEKLGVAEEDQHVEVGHPKTEIIEIAKKLNVDLIVVGSHGRHGLGVLLGSTCNAILHSAPCDVLTVRVLETTD
ncbi:MAG: universal stress protein [Gammaproteobacteria bacterium]|nr:universal stress protein [Gammaproteobacteria bacterium]MCP4474119.1 universal stress protein [Gammaproteobacteria bacterium]